MKVVMPPAGGRAHPVDLWLCGHHFRVSLPVLFAAGASVEDLTMTADPLRTEYAVSAVPRPRRRERA